MKKNIFALAVIFIFASGAYPNWNNASEMLGSFLKAMNKADKNLALKYCAYQMKDYVMGLSSYFNAAKKNPSKYKAYYYVFKKEQNAGSYSFYTFIHIPSQKAVRYAIFIVDNVNGIFKITKMIRINPFRVVNP